jgi:hypothetical protein
LRTGPQLSLGHPVESFDWTAVLPMNCHWTAVLPMNSY